MAVKTLVITPSVLARLTIGESVEIPNMHLTLVPNDEIKRRVQGLAPIEQPSASSGPICITCGMLMTVNGSCYKCQNCGSTSGCS